MELESIMLWHKSDRERQILYDLTYYIETVKKKLIEKEIRFVVTRSRGCEEQELEEGDQTVHTSGCKINKYEGWNVQHDDYG